MPRSRKTAKQQELFSIAAAGRELGVSISTIWRMVRRGELPTVRLAGRRLVPRKGLRSARHFRELRSVPPLTTNHSLFGLIGAGRSGGAGPGSSDKYAVLDS
ncbi:MAG: helix-turn-helix domain-containing protein [Myxococcaceae bacterium]|nr:helix-turn-helix domain-containing protein [Myxococcaceae bacterium]